MFDLNTDPLVESAVLVTVITEAVLKESIVGLLQRLKVQGYAVSEVAGMGYRRLVDRPSSGLSDTTSVDAGVEIRVEIKAIVSKEAANVLFYALKEQQRNFAIVAYRQEVEALSEV